MTAYPETCLVDCEDGHRTVILLEDPSDADTETGALARLTVLVESRETTVRLSTEAVDVLIERLRELRGERTNAAERAAQVVPRLPEVALGDSVRCSDEGDELSIERRGGHREMLPLLWMRLAGDDGDHCVVLDDDELLKLAALYIDPRGPYPARLGPALCWDESRDARLYDGPHPVVAHPPCGPWGRQRHNYRGTEHGCAPRAVAQVRRWGGVLEHPAGSLLFGPEPPCLPASEARPDYDGQHCRHWWECDDEEAGPDVHCCRCGFGAPLPRPGEGPDRYGGSTVEVEQVEWGHPARKRTWLYVVGVDPVYVARLIAARPFPGREPTHWCSGGGSGRGKPPPGIKICSAEQRRRTPPAFAEFLIALARSARRPG